MRVIAGSARRLQLKTVEGMDTRPTQDRIKETLFNMINNDLYGAAFLDLFAGSGAIGIEALSRGAKEAVFIDIRDNLKTTRLEEKALVMNSDVVSGLKMLERNGKKYDLVFMDPPYDRELEKHVMETFQNSCLADEDTLFIIEASLGTDFSWAGPMGYEIIRTKEYKTNKHVFLMKALETDKN